MKLSIFTKARVASKGDRVSCYCEWWEGVREDCVSAFEKPAVDETLKSFMASENHLANVLKPASGCDSVIEEAFHTTSVKGNRP